MIKKTQALCFSSVAAPLQPTHDNIHHDDSDQSTRKCNANCNLSAMRDDSIDSFSIPINVGFRIVMMLKSSNYH